MPETSTCITAKIILVQVFVLICNLNQGCILKCTVECFIFYVPDRPIRIVHYFIT